ncbi:MAG TPA: hypothetical protein DCL86_12475 [Bacteroidales bacterium]|nr:hypothetical protein [Bacteroidales bacterium]
MPGIAERTDLWKKSFPAVFKISKDIDWQQIASGYELSGAGIVNVAHSCAIGLLAEKKQQLSLEDLKAAIRREYIKEGRVV